MYFISKRASDLLEMITLNEVTFNHIDIPPMKYDTFIRFFGKTDTKQVSLFFMCYIKTMFQLT